LNEDVPPQFAEKHYHLKASVQLNKAKMAEKIAHAEVLEDRRGSLKVSRVHICSEMHD